MSAMFFAFVRAVQFFWKEGNTGETQVEAFPSYSI